MEVGVETLGAHLGHLLDVVAEEVVDELLQAALGVDDFQLLLVQPQLLVHPALVLQLERYAEHGELQLLSVFCLNL